MQGLKDITVIQVGNEVVVDYMGTILADYGANLYKTKEGAQNDVLMDRNKKKLNQKFSLTSHTKILQQTDAIIFLESYENVEKVAETLRKKYPRLIILIAYKINERHKSRAHDVNLFSMSGLLSTFGQSDNEKDNLAQYPSILLSILAANSGAIFILQSIIERRYSKQGRIINLSMIHSAMYLNLFNLDSFARSMLRNPRGQNMLDGGAPFYRIYETKDDYICVGAIQNKFYDQMLNAMKFPTQIDQFLRNNQVNQEQWPKIKAIFTEKFKQKNTNQWIKIFQDYDTCMTPINHIKATQYIEAWPRITKLTSKL